MSMRKVRLVLLLGIVLMGLGACGSHTLHVPPKVHFLTHMRVGFSIGSVASVDNAAALGIDTVITYGAPFTPSDAVGAEMLAHGMHEIDASISSFLYYYECHRTYTVALPPIGTTNTYCTGDTKPALGSESALLAGIDARLRADAHNRLIVGHWVLDDWPLWDGGSARLLLQTIHQHIRRYTPSSPAICGFGVAVDPIGTANWRPQIALNYSNAGCDMLGIYSYANTYPFSSYVDNSAFDFSMTIQLHAALQSFSQQGWNLKTTPLIGIGQAFAGLYNENRYQPGLSSAQMLTQAMAFCNAGASSIGWYAWKDSGFNAETQQPMTSMEIQQGIHEGISACQDAWEQ